MVSPLLKRINLGVGEESCGPRIQSKSPMTMAGSHPDSWPPYPFHSYPQQWPFRNQDELDTSSSCPGSHGLKVCLPHWI
jgi:hypothetical protein